MCIGTGEPTAPPDETTRTTPTKVWSCRPRHESTGGRGIWVPLWHQLGTRPDLLMVCREISGPGCAFRFGTSWAPRLHRSNQMILRQRLKRSKMSGRNRCQIGAQTWVNADALRATRSQAKARVAACLTHPTPPWGRQSLADYVAGIGTRDWRPPSDGVEVDYPLNPQHGGYRS